MDERVPIDVFGIGIVIWPVEPRGDATAVLNFILGIQVRIVEGFCLLIEIFFLLIEIVKLAGIGLGLLL